MLFSTTALVFIGTYTNKFVAYNTYTTYIYIFWKPKSCISVWKFLRSCGVWGVGRPCGAARPSPWIMIGSPPESPAGKPQLGPPLPPEPLPAALRCSLGSHWHRSEDGQQAALQPGPAQHKVTHTAAVCPQLGSVVNRTPCSPAWIHELVGAVVRTARVLFTLSYFSKLWLLSPVLRGEEEKCSQWSGGGGDRLQDFCAQQESCKCPCLHTSLTKARKKTLKTV